MFKVIRIVYDEELYEVYFCGHVIDHIVYSPQGQLDTERPRLEQLDVELQDIIINAIISYGETQIRL